MVARAGSDLHQGADRPGPKALAGDLDGIQRAVRGEVQVRQVGESRGIHGRRLTGTDSPDVGVTLLEGESRQLADVDRPVRTANDGSGDCIGRHLGAPRDRTAARARFREGARSR